jgi:hypothetical protein
MAALTGLMLAFGLIAGIGTAPAARANLADPIVQTYETQQSNGWCSIDGFGGNIFCNTSIGYEMPNGYEEVFGIGTDHAAWTRWTSSSGLSSWVSLNGICEVSSFGGTSIGIPAWNSQNEWNWTIQCIGSDGNYWYRSRVQTSGGSGYWTGWATTY